MQYVVLENRPVPLSEENLIMCVYVCVCVFTLPRVLMDEEETEVCLQAAAVTEYCDKFHSGCVHVKLLSVYGESS